MAFVDRLTDPQVSKWFALFVEGVPQVFTSQVMPSVFYTGGRSEIVALDVSGGISPPAQMLNRKAGAASPTQMTFRIGPDDKSGTLRSLFATRLATAARTRITQTLDWTTGAAGVGKLYVADNSDFPASGDACAGRETVGYESTGTDGTGDYLQMNASRAKYGSSQWKFTVDERYNFGTRYVSTNPERWEGRKVTLHMGICNANGQPLDTAFDGNDQRAIWSGTITGLTPNQDWASWSMACISIDQSANTEIGGFQGRGKLVWTTGDSDVPWDEWANGKVYLAEAAPVELELYDTAAASWTDLSTTVAAGQHNNLLADVMDAIQASLDATYPASTNVVYFAVEYTYDSDFNEWAWAIVAETDYANAGEVRSSISPTSAFRWLGFKPGTVVWGGGSGAYIFGTLLADTNPPPLLLIPKTATAIIVREDVSETGETFPNDGYAILKNGDHSEIISYTGVTEISADTPRILQLTGVVRGQVGTTAKEIRVDANKVVDGDIEYASAEEIGTIKSCIAFDGESVLDIFLKLAMSTGSTGLRNATYDVASIGEYVAAGMDEDRIDIDRFEYISATLGASAVNRTVAFAEPFNLREWFASECAVLGLTLLSRTTPNGYQITVDPVQFPAIIGGRPIGDDDISLVDWPDIETSVTQIANRLEFRGMWLNAEEKWHPHTVLINDQNSQIDNGIASTVKMEVKGLIGGVDDVTVYALEVGTRLLAHYANKYSIVRLTVKKSGWAFRVGEEIRVTLDGVPNEDGTAGWSNEPMLLLAVDNVYAGSGNSSPVRLTLLKAEKLRLSYYVPTAEVATTPAADTITVESNVYTDGSQPNPITGDDPAKDIDQFEAGMTVYFRTPGDEATNEGTGVIQSVTRSTNTIVFTAPYPAFVGAGDVVCYPGYASADATQKSYVYLADNGATLGASADDPFVYGA